MKHIATLDAFSQDPCGTPSPKLIEPSYVLILIIALSAAIRLPAIFSDFWLDEIWSLSATREFKSAVEVFTKFNFDNNHHLNSLFLYALGDQRYWELYRIPSLLSGVAIVLLAWWIVRPEGLLEAVLASTLTGFSYPLIHYSSEARGYSLAVMFAFAGLYALRRFADQRTWLWAIAFWGCTALGILSHLTYLFFLFAALIWLPLQQSRRQGTGVSVVGPLLQAFCVPGAFLLFFYLTVLRRVVVGGGPPYAVLHILVQTLSYTGGGPPGGPAAVAVGLSVLLAFLAATLWHRRRDPPLGAFYFVVVIYPAILLTVRQPEVLHPRYLLVSIAFGLLAVSGLLAGFLRRGPSAKVGVGAILVLFTLGNSLDTAKLMRYGRGGYMSAVRYMESHTAGRAITVASDYDFQDRVVLDYYQRFLQPGKTLVYYSAHDYPSNGTQWFLLHSLARSAQVPLKLQDSHGNTYRLEREYPSSDLSGIGSHLYQRLQRASGQALELECEGTTFGMASCSL